MSKKVIDFDKEDYGSRPKIENLSKKQEKMLNAEASLALGVIKSSNKILFALIILIYFLIIGIKHFLGFCFIESNFNIFDLVTLSIVVLIIISRIIFSKIKSWKKNKVKK